MAAFSYRALDLAGKELAGVIEADTGRTARGLLRQRGLFPLAVAAVGQEGGKDKERVSLRRIKSADLTLLTRQWASLLASGLNVEKALAALIEQASSESIRQLLAGVRSEVLAGFGLQAALERFPQAFPALYRASVAAGEKSGELPRVMEQLADYLEQSHALRLKTLQALLYPMIVASIALLVIVGLMTYVVPQVISVFQQSKQALPLLTRGSDRGQRFVAQLGLVGGFAADRRRLVAESGAARYCRASALG
jgi:general secretion pathway protein F